MKKVLYGTTAIVAAGALLSAPASAAEKIKLGVGGYWQTMVTFVDQDSDLDFDSDFDGDTEDVHTVNFRQEGEVHFTGSTTLDNGLEVAVQIQLEGVTQSDQIDEHYASLSGGWGRIDLGAENSASYKMGYLAPAAGWGVNSPNFLIVPNVVMPTSSVVDTATSDANKITYYSPRFSGFQLGVSYTPNIDARGGDRQTSGFSQDDELGDYSDFITVGANFEQSFSGVDLAVSGGYVNGNLEDNPGGLDDLEEFGIGLNVGFAGFTVGGSVLWSNQLSPLGVIATDDIDKTVWDVGATYGTGPWTVGVTWLHSELDLDGPEIEWDHFEIGGSYNLGPGVTAVAAIQFANEDLDEIGGVDVDHVAGALGLKLSF